MKKKRSFFRTAALILCVMMVMTCFTGCKYSPKLHQLIQDRFNHLLDTQSAKEYENDFNRVEKTDDLKAKELDETSERKKEENEEKPVEGQQNEEQTEQPAAESVLSTGNHAEASASNQQNPAAVSQGSSAESHGSGTAGNAAGSGNGNAGTGGSGGNGTGGSGSGNGGTGEGEGTGETGESGVSIVPEAEGTRPIVDDRGETVDIPEEIHSLACSGQSAALFCAVGGEQLIQASSESFLSNPLLDGSISARIRPLWRGNGTGMMTDADFASLMELRPEVLVELSGSSSFTGEQIGQLEANGIRYVVFPALDSLENIQRAVQLAGQMTGDRSASGGVNGEALASQYGSYVNSIRNNTQSKARSAGTGSGFSDLGISGDGNYNGKYSLYIQGWDDTASYSISNSGFSGTGVAWSGNNMTKTGQLMTSLMSIGGVYNTILKVDQLKAKNLYIIPLAWWQSTMTLTLNGSLIASEGSNGHIVRKKLLEHQNQMLGSGAFPAVIAGDQSTANGVLSSALWKPGSDVKFGEFNVNGFLSADGATGIASSIAGDFSAYVSPSGLGSWTGGSPETILESAWIASRFFGAYSDQELAQMIGEFYSQFYRISLDSSQINAILTGSIG